MNKVSTTAVFIANYTIGNSPSILNLLDLLASRGAVDVYLNNAALKKCDIWQNPNTRLVDFGPNPLPGSAQAKLRQGYDHYIAIDPHGFVLCLELFPQSQPVYYSLELYLKNDHDGLDYSPQIMAAERSQINRIKGLIIQSEEKEHLFRQDYALESSIPSFILPVTYKGPSDSEKSQFLRQKYNIGPDKKIALHLGGIAHWFCCIEIALVFSKIKNWVLFFQGYPNGEYLARLKDALKRYGVTNVIISDETYDGIGDVDRIIKSCDLGIAWYSDLSTGFRTAGKSSGKIPAYMRFGLPVVAKKYPSTTEAIEQIGAGICVDDFIEIPDALAKIERKYDKYSRDAGNEYDRTYWFSNYRSPIMEFIDRTNADRETDHFRWDKILAGTKVEDFMVTDELWGENQGVENPSRMGWHKYLRARVANGREIRALEIGFGSGVDYYALDREGLLDKGKVEYFGADVTHKFVDYAKDNFTKMKPVLTNGYDLPFEDNFFDVVYLRHILEHQTHYRPLLSEIFRVCRGHVYLVFFIALSDEECDSIRPSESFYHNVYSRKHFYSFVKQMGYVPNEIGTYCKNGKTDQIFILTQAPAEMKKSVDIATPAITGASGCEAKAVNLHPTAASKNRDGLSILETVEFYHPHVGGAELVIQEIAERLVKRGHRVTVATTADPNRTFNQLNGVDIAEFRVTGNIAAGYGGMYGIQGPDIEKYRRFLLTHPADVMMNYAAQQWATDLAFEILPHVRHKRVNILAPCGYSALSDRKTIRWPIFTEYFKRTIPAYVPQYDAVVYHSSQYQDYEFGQDHGFRNSVIIHNGVDEEEFTKKPAINFREKYGVTTKYMGLSVGNFYGPRKRQDRIIEAVRQMNRPDFTMVFVGKEGPPLADYRKLAQGLKVQFLTDISREDTVAAYHSADLFMLGSDNEASPLVIIEAKASRTPFISTDCGNVREWQGGVVCSPEKMAFYANGILDDETIHASLAESGYREWKEKLTWESVVDRYEQLYLKLHAQKNACESVNTGTCVQTV